ncbi:MAG: metalloregulator ArsR/SmtB family transcription factor [Elusimicrobiaceae bacterium]
MDNAYAKQAEIIKSLAHPTRLMIIHELMQGERCVCALTEKSGADISTVSKHLSILKNTGIIKFKKRGTHIYYSLACSCASEFFRCVEKLSGHSS